MPSPTAPMYNKVRRRRLPRSDPPSMTVHRSARVRLHADTVRAAQVRRVCSQWMDERSRWHACPNPLAPMPLVSLGISPATRAARESTQCAASARREVGAPMQAAAGTEGQWEHRP